MIITSDALTSAVVSGGAVPALIDALNSADGVLSGHALFAISNLAGASIEYRDMLLASNIFAGLHGILRRLQKNHDMGYTSATACDLSWAVSNVCHWKPAPPLDLLMPALPILNTLFESERADTLTNVFHAFASITNGSDVARIDAVLRLGVLPRVIQRLYATRSPDLQLNALKVVGNVSAGNELHVMLLVNQRVEEELTPLLQHAMASVRSDVCWIFSNLLTGPAGKIQHLLSVIPLLVPMVESDESKVRRQALWAIANATVAAAPERLPDLLRQDVLSVFSSVIQADEGEDVDDQMVVLALDGVESVLTGLQSFDNDLYASVHADLSDPEEGIVSDLVHFIQHHERLEVQQRAARLWLRFFQ